MFNENPDKEDYAETATAGGGVGGGGLECRCFRLRFSAAAMQRIRQLRRQSPRKSRTEYLCTQMSTAKTTRHRPPPPRRGGGQLGCRTSSAACARRSNPSTSLPASAYRRRSLCPSRTRSTNVESDACRSARYTPRWTMVLYPCTWP